MSEQSWADILRRAVDASDLSRYAICQAADIQQSMLARFMAGASINLATAERIGRVLGLELIGPKQRRKKG